MQNCRICTSNIQVLGIEQLPTSESEIKQAYRDAAKVWHPDRFQGEPRLAKKAEEQFKRVQSAYQQLTEHARLHGNYGSNSHESKSPRAQEIPQQQSDPKLGQLERFLSAIERRTDGRRFFDESRLPPEMAKEARQILPDYSRRLLGVVDTSMTPGTMCVFLVFSERGIAHRERAHNSSARIVDYRTLANTDLEMRKVSLFDRLAAASESTLGVWLGRERVGEMLNDDEAQRLFNLLRDLQFVVRNPNYGPESQ